MKAARIEEFGGPEVLQTADVPAPEPGEDEVLVELRASGVDRADVLTRGGGYHAAGQPPMVPGFEGSGIVRETGAAVTGVSVGDRVLAFGVSPGSRAARRSSSGRRRAAPATRRSISPNTWALP